jgi:transcription elongation GreA/GreB family factor
MRFAAALGEEPPNVSRAFVSEDAAEARDALLADRPVSAAPNLVTERGLALIEAEIARLVQGQAETPRDDPGRPPIDRDLRYWRARRAAATLVPFVTGSTEVAFGCRVTVCRAGGGLASYQIVGEDEADPRAGLLGWTSPLAAALIGARIGETVEVGGGRPSVTIEAIEEAK